MSVEKPGLEVPEHFPYVTRSLLRLYEEGELTNVQDIVVEPEYGYVARINYSDGSHRITYGNDLGLNTGAATKLAKDKGHSKFMLRTIGVQCPDGSEFLLPWWAEKMASRNRFRAKEMRTTDQASDYVAESPGYPVYAKPVSGSLGGDIYKITDEDQLADVIEIYKEKRIRVALIEEAIEMPDYRVVMLDGELISAYRRDPLQVIGNGTSTVRELIFDKAQQYIDEERNTSLDPEDPGLARHLSARGIDLDATPAGTEVLVLSDVSNLSAGGTSVDVTRQISDRWEELANKIAGNFCLRLCGIDLACEDITCNDADYSVIEVNASPGLDHYAMSGEEQRKVVDDLYTKVLNALPQ